MLNERTISDTILQYSMRRLTFPTVEDMRIKGIKRVGFTVVDSKFNILHELPDTPFNLWRKNYNKLYDEYKDVNTNVTKYILISDQNNNVIYCNRIIR